MAAIGAEFGGGDGRRLHHIEIDDVSAQVLEDLALRRRLDIAEELEQDDAQREDVCLLVDVIDVALKVHQLRRDVDGIARVSVMQCVLPSARRQRVVLVEIDGNAKVAQFEHVVPSAKYIGRLQVDMDDVERVHVSQATAKLLENLQDLQVVQAVVVLHDVLQCAALIVIIDLMQLPVVRDPKVMKANNVFLANLFRFLFVLCFCFCLRRRLLCVGLAVNVQIIVVVVVAGGCAWRSTL